jgi:endonuclease YncB( thermonuclease family)
MGIDTPESRTSDKVEDLFGELAKARLKELIAGKSGPILKTQINKDGEDMKGKFGRILGDFEVEKNGERRMATDVLIEEGHAVAYFGGSKEEIQMKHMANREKLTLCLSLESCSSEKNVSHMEKERMGNR